jgi:folate-binding protein YgfZ
MSGVVVERRAVNVSTPRRTVAVVSSSSLLALPGAVAAADNSPDATVAWHYGDPFPEQRAAERGAAVVDRSHRFVIAIDGAERLGWLHTISSQHIAELRDGEGGENLDLDPHGRVLHHFALTDLNGTLWLDTEPFGGQTLLDYLRRMVFRADAAPRDGNAELAVLSLLGPNAATVAAALGGTAPTVPYRAVGLPDGGFLRAMPYGYDLFVPRAALRARWDTLTAAGAVPVGMWAFEALRVAAHRPRVLVDTDDKTIPQEAGWIGGIADQGAVHLNKGCYRGQETVARVHNLGKPPRHLVLLHLDGSADGRPATGDPVTAGGRAVGRLGSVVDHYELGPIALALIKRSVSIDTPLTAGPCAAAIDPDSAPTDDEPQAGRLAVERLRGR